MKKKLIVSLLSVVVLLAMIIPAGMLWISANADEAKNTTTGTSYATLAQAVAAANQGDTIQLLKDISVNAPIDLKGNINIDGNGKTITGTASGADFNGGVFNVIGFSDGDTTSAADTTGTLGKAVVSNLNIETSTMAGFHLFYKADLTLNDVNIDVAGRSGDGLHFDAFVYFDYNYGDYSVLTINSGEYTCGCYGIWSQAKGITVNINGGTFKALDNSSSVRMLQMAQRDSSVPATWNIRGGTFTAKNGFPINMHRNVIANIYGGTFNWKQTNDSPFAITQGTINFYGGTFNSDCSTFAAGHSSADENAAINVLGGTFNSAGSVHVSQFGGKAKISIMGGIFHNTLTDEVSNRSTIYPLRDNGATLRLEAALAHSGIRFSSYVTKQVVEQLSAFIDAGTELSYGTLLIPADKLDGIAMQTHEGFAAANLVAGTDYVDVPAVHSLKKDADGNVFFNAALIDIKAENYDRDIAAISYIKYVVGGVDYYAYSIVTNGDIRSAKQVSRWALIENSTTATLSAEDVAKLEAYNGGKEEGTYMTSNIMTLNILVHDLAGKENNYKLYPGQTVNDYTFFKRLNYFLAAAEYAQPDILMLQEFSGTQYWGSAFRLKTVDAKGVYSTDDLPGYTWVNHGNREGKLYHQNTASNYWPSHNFVIFNSEKYNYIDSGMVFLTDDGTRATQWKDHSSDKASYAPNGFTDLGDFTWVVLEDKATGIRAVYASIHSYQGATQRVAYIVENLQNAVEHLEKVSQKYDNAPIIVAGDYNLTPGRADNIYSYETMTVSAGYTDAQSIGNNVGTARVFNNDYRGYNGSSSNGERIDLIMMQGAEPYHYEVMDGFVQKTSGGYVYNKVPNTDGSGYDISDHQPVLASVIIGTGDNYKSTPLNKDNYYKNAATADDKIVTDNTDVTPNKNNFTFTSTDILSTIAIGDKMSAAIVEDAERGNVLRLMATDETNSFSATINYKNLFGTISRYEISEITITYKVEASLENHNIDLNASFSTTADISNGSMLKLDTSAAAIGEWKTVTIEADALRGNLVALGIYGASENTGLLNGDAVYIASITLS